MFTAGLVVVIVPEVVVGAVKDDSDVDEDDLLWVDER